MTYYGRKDGYYSSKSSNNSSNHSTRDYEHLKSHSSQQYSRNSRDDGYSKRDYHSKQDQTALKHSKYRNSKFYPSDKNVDFDRQQKRSRSPSPNNKNVFTQRTKLDELRNENNKETTTNQTNSENGGESNVFSRYQQKTWNSKPGESSENDKRASILIRCLDQEVTEDQVESVVSDIAIRNGFSTPNSVQFKTFHTNSVSGSLHTSDKSINTSQFMEPYSYAYSLEKVAIVKFPSFSAAGRFMSSNKSKSIKIGGREYYIEYDTSDTDTSMKSNQESLMPAVSEIATLLQKRKMTADWTCPSCRFLNFSKRVLCLSCGVPKPTEAELESQNLAIELAALNQAQMLQSNLSDVSPWVVLKNIPGDADPAKLVLTICNSVPDAPSQLQKCVYVIDTDTNSKRGFMFAQFASPDTVDKYIAKRGDKRSELVVCGNTYHRLDTVRSREKNVAEELLKKVKMANFKVNYEFDIITSETTLSSEDNTMTQLNKQYRSCKVKTTNIQAIQQQVVSNDTHTMSQVFFSNWLSESISLPSGKPDTATFVYDPGTDYFFDHRLCLYYDAATTYYMSPTGNYYLWDEPSSSLKRVDPNMTDQPKQEQIKEVKPAAETNSISNILASAMKVAKVSQQNVQKLSSVITEKNQASKTTSKSKSINSKTFELGDDSDGESPMDVEDNSQKKEIKMNIAGSTPIGRPQAQPISSQNKSKSVNICFVCLRMFDTPDKLNFHEKESKYHQALLTHYETQPH